MSYFELSTKDKLYYEDRGTGSEVIIFMHGWTSSHKVYDPVIEELKNDYRCITYDHRGHYASKAAGKEDTDLKQLAADLHELILGLDLKDVNLLGWSMGTGVALTYFREYGSERIKRLILCDMTPKQLNDEHWKLGLYKGAYTAEDMKNDEGKDFLELYRSFAINAIPVLKLFPARVINPKLQEVIDACDVPTLRSLGRDMKAQDLRETVRKIDVPLTYFYAEPGSIFTPKLAEWYKLNVSVPFQAIKIKRSTHMLVEEHPKKIVKGLQEILK